MPTKTKPRKNKRSSTVKDPAVDFGWGLESPRARALIRACAYEGKTPAETAKVLQKEGFKTNAKGVKFLREMEAQSQRLFVRLAGDHHQTMAEAIEGVVAMGQSLSLAAQILGNRAPLHLEIENLPDLQTIIDMAPVVLRYTVKENIPRSAVEAIADDYRLLVAQLRANGQLSGEVSPSDLGAV